MIYSFRIEDSKVFDPSEYNEPHLAQFCKFWPDRIFFIITAPDGSYVSCTHYEDIARSVCSAFNRAMKEGRI